MRVRVEDAPGYENFEGDLIMEVESPEGRRFSVIEWRSRDYYDDDSPRDNKWHMETFIIPSVYVHQVSPFEAE